VKSWGQEEIRGGNFLVFSQREIRCGWNEHIPPIWWNDPVPHLVEYSVSRNSSIPLFCLTEHEDGYQVQNGSTTFHFMTPTEHTLSASWTCSSYW
jgi:hypothetical protein